MLKYVIKCCLIMHATAIQVSLNGNINFHKQNPKNMYQKDVIRDQGMHGNMHGNMYMHGW